MKRIALITLLAFATTHAALADRKNEKKRTRVNQAVAKTAGRGSVQPRHSAQQFRSSVARPQAARSFQANQFRNRNAALRTRTRTPQVVTPNNANVSSRVHDRGNSGRNWQNNGDAGHNNNHFANRGDDGRRRHGNWNRNRHDRSWWRSNYTRFALFGGGYYYWNSGYWYPAYGYDPYFSSYSYDAPIYAYNDQDPGQVISNVQVELQRLGYNPGGIDGTFGPMTRSALLRFQSDNGLPATGEIDEATLSSLGLQ